MLNPMEEHLDGMSGTTDAEGEQSVEHTEEEPSSLPVQQPQYSEQQTSAQTADAGVQYHAVQPAPQEHCSNQEEATNSLPKGLTFSGPPYVPKAKPYRRVDFSHSKTKLLKIAHDNQKLVQRLTSISHKEPSWAKNLTSTPPCNVASSAVNRHKAASTIAQENHALYQRLVAIKPSKDISRETLEAEHRRNEAYRINCATFKPGAASNETA